MISAELVVLRETSTDHTPGELLWDGLHFCYTCEDVVRPPGVKVDGQTAIGEGRYRVVLDFSARFRKIMPHVLYVPGFEGIRIHPGNTVADTEGCLLVGMGRTNTGVSQSVAAFDKLISRLTDALSKGEVWITYQNPPTSAS